MSAAAASSSSSSAGKARANPAAAALAEVTAKYERSAAVGAEQQKIILALQARNDNLELANRGLEDCRNSMGVILSYIDRVMPHNVDAEHLRIWLKIRKDATAVAHEAKLAREEDEYARVAQQGPPERVLGCPVPGLRMAGVPGGDATPQQPRGTALVDPHPPAAKKAKTSSRPEGIIGAKAVYVKTHIDEVRRANPTAGRDLLNLVGKGYEALTDAQKAPYRQSASEQSEINAQLRAEGKPTNKAVGLVLAVDEDGETAMAVEEPGTPPRALPAPEDDDDDEEREARRAAKKKKKKTKDAPAPPADAASSDEER